MFLTNSPLLHGFVGTPFKGATFPSLSGTMSDTHPPFHDIVIAPLDDALLYLRAMGNTNSSTPGIIVTSLKFASLRHYYLGTMGDTHSTLLDLLITSRYAASLHLRTVCSTYSSLPGLFGTSLKATTFLCHIAVQ